MTDNDHYLSREEQIEEWISKETLRKKRRKKIIPSSTDSITQTPLGDPLDAMAKVACYLGDHPELPIVEMGIINENIVGLTFGKSVKLEHPFELESEQDGSHWNISHRDALSLSTGRTYGWQSAALTAIGNSPNGDKMLLNTNRWHVLGIAGLDQFISAVMVGQVMEHATEPWTREHHIWLVGYRDLGPKLLNFLTIHHDKSYFHLVETVEQITADDIRGTTATLYVKNSNAATLEAFQRLRAENPDHVGMLTDTIVTERAMFISENDDDSAVICNAAPHSIQFFPNIIGENHPLYMAMDLHWDKHLEEAERARQAVESVTMADFLPTQPEQAPAAPVEKRAGASSISVEDLEALWNGGTAVRNSSAQPETQPTPTRVSTEVNLETLSEAPTELSQAPAETELHADMLMSAQPSTQAPLTILGEPMLHGANGFVEGKPAEAVAYVYLNELARDGVDVSQSLWPEADVEGNTARTRRARTTKAIRDALPGAFRVEGSRWVLDPVATDLDRIFAALTSPRDTEETLRACEAIKAPLQGCGAWADEPRAQIVGQLRGVLEDVMDRALDHDHIEVVKAVRQAIKKL